MAEAMVAWGSLDDPQPDCWADRCYVKEVDDVLGLCREHYIEILGQMARPFVCTPKVYVHPTLTNKAACWYVESEDLGARFLRPEGVVAAKPVGTMTP